MSKVKSNHVDSSQTKQPGPPTSEDPEMVHLDTLFDLAYVWTHLDVAISSLHRVRDALRSPDDFPGEAISQRMDKLFDLGENILQSLQKLASEEKVGKHKTGGDDADATHNSSSASAYAGKGDGIGAVETQAVDEVGALLRAVEVPYKENPGEDVQSGLSEAKHDGSDLVNSEAKSKGKKTKKKRTKRKEKKMQGGLG